MEFLQNIKNIFGGESASNNANAAYKNANKNAAAGNNINKRVNGAPANGPMVVANNQPAPNSQSNPNAPNNQGAQAGGKRKNRKASRKDSRKATRKNRKASRKNRK